MSDIKALHEAATPAPWSTTDWLVAGVLPEKFGDGCCAYCSNPSLTLVRTELGKVNGNMMTRHWHAWDNDEGDDGHTVYAGEPGDTFTQVVGSFDYNSGGFIETADRDFIVALRNAFASGDLVPRAEVDALVEVAKKVFAVANTAAMAKRHLFDVAEWSIAEAALNAALDALRRPTCPTCGSKSVNVRLPAWKGRGNGYCTDPFHGTGSVTP